jgi:endonuclease III
MNEPCKFEQDIGFIKAQLENLNKTLNGNVAKINEHIKESPIYRSKIEVLEKQIEIIDKEKLNSVKQAQWRIALIAGLSVSIVNIIASLLIRFVIK